MAAIFAAISISGAAWGQAPRADPPLVENGGLSLSTTDFEAYLQNVPDKLRPDFRSDVERVKKTVDGLWVQRMVAERARAGGLANDPIVAARLRQAQEAVLVDAYMRQVEKDMKYPDLLPRAREVYRAHPDDYKVVGKVHVQHILIDVKCRNREEALKRAREVRNDVVAGKEDFKAIAKRVSDDPSKEKNSGDLGPMQPSAFDEQFRNAIAKLTKPGEVSEPIETRFGFHIVKLVKREPDRVKPFEEVKEEIIAAEKQKLVDEVRTNAVIAARSDPKNHLHLENVEALADKARPGSPATPDAKPKAN